MQGGGVFRFGPPQLVSKRSEPNPGLLSGHAPSSRSLIQVNERREPKCWTFHWGTWFLGGQLPRSFVKQVLPNANQKRFDAM